MSQEPAAEWVNRSVLSRWADNPRNNDGKPVAKVADSIRRFGWGSPIVARRSNGEIIAGHTRDKAAEALASMYQTASESQRAKWHPDAIRTATTGEVPVRFGEWSEYDAHLLALADNPKDNEHYATWDTPKLQDVLSDFGLDDVELAGWDQDSLSAMAAEIAVPDFSPASEDEQGRLDKSGLVTCPECGHEFTP